MKNRLNATTFLLSLFISSGVSAGHFNPNNLIAACKEDSSFHSVCYTYIAAYADLMADFVMSSDEERIQLLCLMDLSTKEVAEHLAKAQEPYKFERLPDYLAKRYCE